MTVQLPRLEDLSDPVELESVLGPIHSIDRVPVQTVGFSQARHERLTVHRADGSELRFVLKRFSPASSWTAYRTGDVLGREAALLAEPSLAGVWSVFRNPYVAFAIKEGTVGLLMTDLTELLLPEDASRLTEAEEDALLGSLAALHARFWDSQALQTPWLAPLSARFHILHPTAGMEELKHSAPAPVFALVQRGWKIALQTVSARVAARLLQPAEKSAERFSHLPQTLLHGDTKIANFGFAANGALAAFDWATMGRGPATVDLGYCLAINASRLQRDKEGVCAHYRTLLEIALNRSITDRLWEEMITAAVLAGAGMLLWSKALALAEGAPGAADEWDWWAEELEKRVD